MRGDPLKDASDGSAQQPQVMQQAGQTPGTTDQSRTTTNRRN
jgi:hypothetical protein